MAETESWTEWGVRRTWGAIGTIAQMNNRSEAEACAREWPGELVSRTVTAQPWGRPEREEERVRWSQYRAVWSYVEGGDCRRSTLLHHFGDPSSGRAGSSCAVQEGWSRLCDDLI